MRSITYTCRSCGTIRAVAPAEIDAARRGLEQFTDSGAELAHRLAAGDHTIAAEFEFCPACRALEQIADVELDGARGDSTHTSRSCDDEPPDSNL